MNSLISWKDNRPSSFFDVVDFFDNFVPSVFSNENVIKPNVEITETEKELTVKAELPGLTKDDISVELKDSILSLSGEKKIEKSSEEGKLIRTEISYGSFQRSFHIPVDVNSESISANFKDGILTLTLPKSEKEAPKQITIN